MPRLMLDMTNDMMADLRRAIQKSTGKPVDRKRVKLEDTLEAVLAYALDELTRRSWVRIRHEDIAKAAEQAGAVKKDEAEPGEAEKGEERGERSVRFERR